ncbi:MAG TPA: enoyl-CoA hydratase/isomerase family protein [Bordetella sp.]
MIETAMQPPVLWLTVSRPQAANALDAATHDALAAALREAARRPGVGAVVLAAAGGKAYSAGADLREFSEWPAGRAALRRRELLLQTLEALLALGKPVVAAVQAPAIGAGAMLALACDEIVMADGAWLGFPEAQHGMPTPMGAVLLARRARWPVVQRLLQAGERCAAFEALQAGLADDCVAAGVLPARCQARAAALAAIPAHAYAANKAWLNRPLGHALAEAAAYATAHQASDPSH